MKPILKIADLKVDFYAENKVVNTPLRGINLEIAPGQTLGIVGETGCGKTLTATSIMGLLPTTAKISGKIEFAEHGLLTPSNIENIRGSEITMIFQNPQSAFNPIFTIGQQLTLVAQRHGIQPEIVREVLTSRLNSVGLTDTARVKNSYPHELSGGMLQRCMIAMALISTPKLLIADEPTTALDATIGHQVLQLIRKLQTAEDFALIFISHDVSSVAKISDNVAVIYAGKVVEVGPTDQIISQPKHPYTKGLLGAIPSAKRNRGDLTAIPGSVPSNLTQIVGCAFAERCALSDSQCQSEPPLLQIGQQDVACWKVGK